MCGIVGRISLNPKTDWTYDKRWFANALFLDTIRGADATGIMSVPADNPSELAGIYKRGLSAPDFLQLTKTGEILRDMDMYGMIVGHNRKATMGSKNDEAAHPFQVGNITMVHNGTLDTMVGLPTCHPVDSYRICAALDQAGPGKAKEVLESLEGAYTLIWHDAADGTYHMARNKERPLSFVSTKDGNTIYFASLWWMLDPIIDQNVKLNKTFDLKVGAHVTINPSTQKKIEDYKVEEFTPKVKKYTQSGSYIMSTNGTIPDTYGRSQDYNLDIFKGDSLKFKVTKVAPFEYNMELGNVFGTVTNRNGDKVIDAVAYSVRLPGNAKEIKKMKHKEYTGIVNYVFYTKNQPEVVLSRFYEGMNSLDNTIGSPPTKDKPSNTPKTEQYIFHGPNNTWVTRSMFEKSVEDGCSSCTGPIDIGDHREILWLDTDTGPAPVCDDCQKTFRLGKYEGKEQKN